MISKATASFVLGMLLMTGGCATSDTPNDSMLASEPREYPTGSNILRRRPVGASEVKIYDKSVLEEMQQQTFQPEVPPK